MVIVKNNFCVNSKICSVTSLDTNDVPEKPIERQGEHAIVILRPCCTIKDVISEYSTETCFAL